MPHGPPDYAAAPVEIEQIREPAVYAQILRSIRDRTFEQSHELKRDVGEFPCDAQYPVETIEFTAFYCGHIYQDAELLRQRAGRIGNERRWKRHQFAGDAQRPHFSYHPFRLCPMMQMMQYPGIRFPFEDFALFVQRIASEPVHYDFFLAQGVCNLEKFALRDTATKLINQIARGYFAEHRREIPNAFIRIVATLPAVAAHEVGKDWPKIDKAVNEHAAGGPVTRHPNQYRSFRARRTIQTSRVGNPADSAALCGEHGVPREHTTSGAYYFFPAFVEFLAYHVTGV